MRHLSTDLTRNRSGVTSSSPSSAGRVRFRHPNLPPLFYSILNRSWRVVLRRSRTHPHEVMSVDDITGNTPLHFACRLDPPRDVIYALRHALWERNNEGATALHIAASHRCSVEVIQALLELGNDHSSVVPSFTGDSAPPNKFSFSFHSYWSSSGSTKRNHPTTSAMEEPALIHITSSPGISIHERTHMTLTLTKMGRSPLHYACLSYRGLGVEAFSVLLEATIDAFKQVNQLEALKQRDDNSKYKRQGDETLTNQTSKQETESVKLSSNDVEPTHEESNHTSHKSSAFTMLDQTGQSPLALLFQRYKERVRYVVKRVDSVLTPPHRGDRRPSQSSAQATAAIQADLGELWEKAKLIVGKMVQEQQDMKSYGDLWRNKCILDTPFPSLVLEPPTVYASSSSLTSSLFHSDGSIKAEEKDCTIIQKTKKFRILHASVSLTGYGCPSEMICLALSVHPNEIQEMDEDGNLPLHIASIAPSFLGHEPLASSSSKTIKQMDVDPNPFDTVIRLLVRYYPAGAQVPNGVTGHLPLHLALDARQRTWKDGLLALMEAYPPALEGSSLELKLYPYMLSMLGRRSESTDRKSIARQMPRNRNRSKNGQVVKEDMGPPLILFDILRSKPTLFGR